MQGTFKANFGYLRTGSLVRLGRIAAFAMKNRRYTQAMLAISLPAPQRRLPCATRSFRRTRLRQALARFSHSSAVTIPALRASIRAIAA